MVDRRRFLERIMQLTAVTAGGLIVPEWLLDPPRGRSMVSVPGVDCTDVWESSFQLAFSVSKAMLQDAGVWTQLQTSRTGNVGEWTDVAP